MKNKFTKEQLDFVIDLVENKDYSVTKAAQQMCEKWGIEFKEVIGRNFRRKLQIRNITKNISNIEETDVFKLAQEKKHDKSKKRFLISWCQSETKVHQGFLKNLEAYAEYIDAELLIVAGRYKNPSSLESSEKIKKKEKNLKNTWDKSIIPYLDANRQNLHKYLCVLSDVKVQPTASTPLSGFNSITGLESCIIGHPRVHLKSLPVLDGYPNKLLLSTGAVSVENYTDTKVGKKSHFHHQLGCVIVELDGDAFHVRQILADKKGDFYDLIYCVKSGEVSACGEAVPAIVFGDLHVNHHNPEVVEASFDLATHLKAEKIIIHDPIDSSSISHHEKKDPFQLLRREEDGTWSLQKEIDSVLDWFKARPNFNFISLKSNHCEFIDRWLMNEDWRKAPNKLLYLKFANIVAEGKAPKGIIPYIFAENLTNVEALGIDDTYKIKGWEISQHGHIGVHASKPSPIQWKNLPFHTITGHSHVPHREDGHLSVGTLTHLRVGYNHGSSAWLNSNVVIYPNGKASHVHIVKNKYTTLF